MPVTGKVETLLTSLGGAAFVYSLVTMVAGSKSVLYALAAGFIGFCVISALKAVDHHRIGPKEMAEVEASIREGSWSLRGDHEHVERDKNMVLRTAGVFLIIAGILSGVILLLSPFEGFGELITMSKAQFWFFYMLCFIGGFVLYAVGSPKSSTERILRLAGGILVFIGLCAAICLFLKAVSILVPEDTDQLWLLFLLCLPLGVAATIIADVWSRRKVRETRRLKNLEEEPLLPSSDQLEEIRGSFNTRDQVRPSGERRAPNPGAAPDGWRRR